MGRRKKMKQEKLPLGTIYQAKAGGNYYLRYQIQGKRKNVNLNTSDYDAALKEYERLLPTLHKGEGGLPWMQGFHVEYGEQPNQVQNRRAKRLCLILSKCILARNCPCYTRTLCCFLQTFSIFLCYWTRLYIYIGTTAISHHYHDANLCHKAYSQLCGCIAERHEQYINQILYLKIQQRKDMSVLLTQRNVGGNPAQMPFSQQKKKNRK